MIKLSKNAAQRIISSSTQTHEKLLTNLNVMNKNVNSQFTGLQDPTIKRYMELSEQMQENIRNISMRLEAISRYCENVMRWIDTYNEL